MNDFPQSTRPSDSEPYLSPTSPFASSNPDSTSGRAHVDNTYNFAERHPEPRAAYSQQPGGSSGNDFGREYMSGLDNVNTGQGSWDYPTQAYYPNAEQASFNGWPQVSLTNPERPQNESQVSAEHIPTESSPSSTTATSPPSLNPVPEQRMSKDQQRRQANALAARNYRKRGGKVAKLEKELREKDALVDSLKWRLATAEGEIKVLRENMGRHYHRQPETPGMAMSPPENH